MQVIHTPQRDNLTCGGLRHLDLLMPQQMGDTADPASSNVCSFAQFTAPNPRIAKLPGMCSVNGLEYLRDENTVVGEPAPIACRRIGRRIMAQRFPQPKNAMLGLAGPPS